MTDPLRGLSPVVRLAPAKLNLTLAVTGRRADGYHDLHSVIVRLELADLLSIATTPAPSDTLYVAGRDAGPLGENLILRAVARTRAALGRRWPGASMAPSIAARLDKRIPVAAGLGGGSSDAAAAIDAVREAWGVELDPGRREEIAMGLGSDVPFFLAGGSAVVEGRGERVAPLPPLRGDAPGILIVVPGMPVATAEVFAAFDRGGRSRDGGAALATSRHLADEWRAGLDARRLFDRAGVLAPANDLIAATAAVAPDAIATRRALVRLLRRPVGQSGSGPAAWVLYPSVADAAAAALRVEAALADGTLRIPGDQPPSVVATTFASGSAASPIGAVPDPATAGHAIVTLDRSSEDRRRREG